MPGVPPPPDFGRAKLEVETISPGQTFGRIYWSTYPDPLGYGKSPSRFSDPRRRTAANRFGVLYFGDSLKVCFLETVLRDRREADRQGLDQRPQVWRNADPKPTVGVFTPTVCSAAKLGVSPTARPSRLVRSRSNPLLLTLEAVRR